MNLDNLLKTVNQSALEDLDMSRFVSKKTVDEVWRANQRQKKNDGMPIRRKGSLGEMTLGNFLVRAGSEAGGSDKSSESTRESPHWLRQQAQQCVMRCHVPSRPVPLPMDIGASNVILDSVYPDGQVNISSPLLPGRKRVAGKEVAEKEVKMRQNRMLKNRDSAARSRARKQAYTCELENTILRLEEENERLRKEKELDKFLHSFPLPEPKKQLRRSISAPF